MPFKFSDISDFGWYNCKITLQCSKVKLLTQNTFYPNEIFLWSDLLHGYMPKYFLLITQHQIIKNSCIVMPNSAQVNILQRSYMTSPWNPALLTWSFLESIDEFLPYILKIKTRATDWQLYKRRKNQSTWKMMVLPGLCFLPLFHGTFPLFAFEILVLISLFSPPYQ